MQLEHAVAFDAGLAPHSHAVGFRLQSALVGALQDSFPLRLGDCRKDGHHHPFHRSFSSDAVVQEADDHADFLVELLWITAGSCQQCRGHLHHLVVIRTPKLCSGSLTLISLRRPSTSRLNISPEFRDSERRQPSTVSRLPPDSLRPSADVPV